MTGFEHQSEHPQLEKMENACIFRVDALLEEGLSDPPSFSYFPQVRPTDRQTEFVEKARVLKS
jgi:hypothetical protein